MSVPFKTLERAFAEEILDNHSSFYTLNSNHSEHDYGSESTNEYPCIDFHVSNLLWDMIEKRLPDEVSEDNKQDIAKRLEEQFWDFEIEHMGMCAFEDFEGEVFFDMNGYRLMDKNPIKDLLAQREELEEEYDDLQRCLEDDEEDQYYSDEMAEKEGEIEEVDEDICKAAKRLGMFVTFGTEWRDTMKEYYDLDFEVIIDDDDEWLIVNEQEYYDYKDENGWRKWDGKKIIDERTKGNQILTQNIKVKP